MKTNQRGAVDMMLVAALVVVVIVGAIVLVRISSEDEDKASKKEKTDTMQVEETSSPAETSELADDAEAPTNTETAELVAVNGYDASGTATRSYDEVNGFLHEIIAELPEPPADKFYEGWLVGEGTFISTGEVTNEDGSTWSLVYNSDEDLRNLNEVVITEETLADGFDNIPETHVLDGEFAQ